MKYVKKRPLNFFSFLKSTNLKYLEYHTNQYTKSNENYLLNQWYEFWRQFRFYEIISGTY